VVVEILVLRLFFPAKTSVDLPWEEVKTEDALEVMLVHLQKRFLVEFPDGKGILCFYSWIEVVPLTHAGFGILSFDQGNLTLKSDDPGQTWLLSAW